VAIWHWAFEKFQVNSEIPESIKRDWKSWALRERAAAKQPTLQPRLLEDVALSQSGSAQQLPRAPLLPDRSSPKELVDTAKRKPKRSYEKFAAHIGIGKDTLYAITKETRWVSDETYILVAEVCHCKPEDLHPRDIPRPERRR
jgi:hypothetical protein